jgi:hypothetical protein
MINTHKHSWIRTDEEDSDTIVCEKCGIDYDEWFAKMEAKGYSVEQMRRFENE